MNRAADVVVIGGGVVGASIAFALARKRVSVVLLERGRMADEASGNSFAWLNATAETVSAHYHRLNAAGLDAYDDLAAEFSEDALGLGGCGEIQWADPARAETVTRLEARIARLIELGYPLEVLDRSALGALEPNLAIPDGAGGFRAVRDRWLEVPKFVRFLMQRLQSEGGVCFENTAVTGFSASASGRIAAVETYHGSIATPAVVLAAGTATPHLAALLAETAANNAAGVDHVPVDAVPGVLVDAPPDLAGGLIRHILHAPEPGGIHFRPAADGGLLIGADDSGGNSGADPAALRRESFELLDRAARFLPSLTREALRRRIVVRRGMRPIPGDGYPIVGPLSAVDGAYVAVTHSGATLGPLLGRLIAEAITTGVMPQELEPYRPARFDPHAAE